VPGRAPAPGPELRPSPRWLEFGVPIAQSAHRLIGMQDRRPFSRADNFGPGGRRQHPVVNEPKPGRWNRRPSSGYVWSRNLAKPL